MSNTYFQFKQFTVHQGECAMKVTTDSCLFGAWCAAELLTLNGVFKNILDIGTGTGLLSLMVAQKSNAHIDALEIDEAAALQAAQNFSSSLWSNRLHVIKGDVLQLPITKKYDCIICNPPFYQSELKSPKLDKNIAHHSHQLELKELLPNLKKRLTNEGLFFMLLPYKRKDEIEKLFIQNNLILHKMVLVKQTTNHSPFRIMIIGGLQMENNTSVNEIAIWDETKSYTTAFTHLLKDYYLYL